MPMVREDHLTIPVCCCCGAIGPVGLTAFLCNYRARKQEWETPGVNRDGEPEDGCVRCPLCVAADVWPYEYCVPEWHGGPAIRRGDNADAFDAWRAAQADANDTIRLADGDEAADVRLDAMPDALVAG